MPFENFPYTDLHNLNLDWLIKKVKELEDLYGDLQPQPVPPDPVPEWYTTPTELSASEAPVGATVVYQGSLYTISGTDNGYGLPTVNGYAIPVELCVPTAGSAGDLTTLDIGTLAGDTSNRYTLTGCCFNPDYNVYACSLASGTTYKLVEFDDTGTVVNRVAIPYKGNDLAWNPAHQAYMQATMQAGALNVAEITRAGTVQATHQVLDGTYYPSAIGYDTELHRILAYSGNYYLDGINMPVLLVLDDDYNELARHYFRTDWPRIVPNTNPYTASQGGCEYRHGFILSASVFFNDGYTKCGWRLSQLDPCSGEYKSFSEGLYPNAAGTAWEIEGVCSKGTQLVTFGYYNVDATTSTLVIMPVDPAGHGHM